MRRNERKGEVDENGESGENRNSGENLPQVWRIFKLDGKRSSLESGDLKKMANLAKNRQRIDENWNKASGAAPSWRKKIAIMTKMENPAKISHDFCQH